MKLTAPGPAANFGLVLRNGRRIESGWNFRDALATAEFRAPFTALTVSQTLTLHYTCRIFPSHADFYRGLLHGLKPLEEVRMRLL